MLILSKIIKNGTPRIKIGFDYDKNIIEKIKHIPTARFSKSLKAWHIEYSKKAFNQLKLMCLEMGLTIKYLDKTGTIGLIRPENEHTGIDLKKSNSVLSKNDDSKNADIDIAKQKLHIEIHNMRFYIKTRYNTKRIEILKNLNGAWWNSDNMVWISKANIENLEILQKEFNYWNEEEYLKIFDLVALIDDPLILELYRTPDNIKQIWVKIKGFRADINFMKHIPERQYDKRFKRWNLPNDKKVIKRIIKHYKQKGAKIVNRLPEHDKSIYHFNDYSYKQRQQLLIDKYPDNHKSLVKDCSDVMITQRYSWKTIQTYIGSLVKFSQYLKNISIEKAEASDINMYLSKIAGSKISDSKLNTIVSALKFYYTKVIFRPDFEIEKVKRPRKSLVLPNILSKKEIEMLLGALTNIKHITILYTIYSS